MKIESISLYHVVMPMVTAFETSFGRREDRECILVEVNSEGETGWGECPADGDPGYSYETTGTAWHILKDFIAPQALKQDLQPGDLRARVASVRGHPMAKAGLEMALWDLAGKRSGKSLKEMFGAERDRVPVGVSIGLQESPQALVKVIETYLQDGYGRVKIKIKPGRDVGDTAAAREAFPDLLLQVDANSAYTLETAGQLQPLDELDLLLIEQPLAEDDIWDHSQLQRSFGTALCLDESIKAPRHARQALEMQACRVINIKQARVGGLSNALEIHQLCLDQDIPVWCGGMLETGLGRAANLALASLPGFSLPGDISATDRYYRQDITQERFSLNADSTISLPQGPGLGVSVDRDSLNKFAQARLRLD